MKKTLLFFVTVITILILTACGDDDNNTVNEEKQNNSQDKEVITIGYQKGNTINILKENGNLDKALNEAGYTIDWKVFPTGTVLLEALNTNNIDFGHASDGNAVFMQAGGHPLNYVASEALMLKVLH